MAVTIEKRPIGVILGACVSATINQDYNSVYATVNKTSHGLSDGNYVYIQSNVENYNGFWAIEVTNANEFILIDNPYVEWIVDADITYCPQITTHGWSCVHLPIVYKLSNTRWPTNSVDTARTISSISDDNGYVNLNLSGSLGTFEDLSFIKISNSPDSDFDGVYQIIDKLSTSDVTINLSYSSVTASGITGATIQLYYSNYNIVVKVYAGLNSSHTWADQKPYALVATLELIPESDNTVMFSINEYLKDKNMVTNNLLLATLPNNIDAFKQFYIEVAEQYDTSDGYTVGTFEGAFASDQSEFEGYAVNAMLEFKNIQSGYLSDYVMNNSTAKFLTLFTIPVLFSCSEDLPDCYQDVSFINKFSGATLRLKQQYYSNGALQITALAEITSSGEGVYRVPIESDCSYDRVDISIMADFVAADESTFGQFEYTPDGPGQATISAVAGVGIGGTALVASLASAGQVSEIGYVKFDVPAGTYTVGGTSNITVISGTPVSNVRYFLLDSDLNVLDVSSYFSVTQGSPDSHSEALTSAFDIKYIGIQYQFASGANSFTIEGSLNASAIDQTISETKQFKIDCGCANQEIRLSWLNNLGGFDYWDFTGETGHAVDIMNTGETKQNIFPQWPKSYGEHADTIRKQTFRESANRKFVFSQFLTEDEAEAIAYIKSSPLVQIVNSRQDRRTVTVDTDSFTKFEDGDKTFQISFNILYTDDIPSQRA